MSWTDERIEELKRLWEQGLTASQIAEKLGNGISRNAVIGKAHRLDLKSRPSPVKGGDTPAAAASAVASSTSNAPPAESPIAVAPMQSRKPTAPRPAPTSSPTGKATLLDLSDKVCKWPIGHPGEPDFHFCGKSSQPGFPYCSEHCAVAYQAQLPRRDRNSRPLPPMMPGVRPR